LFAVIYLLTGSHRCGPALPVGSGEWLELPRTHHSQHRL